MGDWWTTGNQILTSIASELPFVLGDYLHPRDIASLSQTSTRRHTDCKVILKAKQEELSLRADVSANAFIRTFQSGH